MKHDSWARAQSITRWALSKWMMTSEGVVTDIEGTEVSLVTSLSTFTALLHCFFDGNQLLSESLSTLHVRVTHRRDPSLTTMLQKAVR